MSVDSLHRRRNVGLRVASGSLFALSVVAFAVRGWSGEATEIEVVAAPPPSNATVLDAMPGPSESPLPDSLALPPVGLAPSHAFAVGDPDERVAAIEQSYGVGTIGLIGTGRGGGGIGETRGPAGGYGRGSGAGFGGKGKRVPRVRQGKATVVDDPPVPDRGVSKAQERQAERILRSLRHSPADIKARRLANEAAENRRRQALEEAERARQAKIAARAEHWRELFVAPTAHPQSTFSIDVDTASYSYVRRTIESNHLPAWSDVRVEEMINYFDYDYPRPPAGEPVWIDTEVGPCPWNSANRLVRLGLQADLIEHDEVLPRNLVFLIDVSGSMSDRHRLPLLSRALSMFVPTLRPEDRMSLVVYAGAAGEVLPPTSGADQASILDAIDRLEAGGSTNGGEGIELAYRLAESSFIEGGINRVVLATDGDFNVGTTSHHELVRLVAEKRKSGVYLSVLRVGDSIDSDGTMEQLADRGNGNYAYIDGLREAHKVLVAEAGATLVPVADDVKIQVEFDTQSVQSYRLIGYDNRRLAAHDFANDAKDAGDIGSGRSVTALYEVVPSPTSLPPPKERPLLTVRFRYKHPGQPNSNLIERTVGDRTVTLADTSEAFRFAAAVAQYGELLTGYRFPDGGFDRVVQLATSATTYDPRCHRHEFLRLAAHAGKLSGTPGLDVHSDSTCVPREPPPRRRMNSEAATTMEQDDPVPAPAPRGFPPLVLLAAWLELVAASLRRVPAFVCALPAIFAVAVLALTHRRAP